jgi:mycoredoxin
MSGLTLYTSADCGFCARLTGRLDKAGVEYEQVDVDGDPDVARWVEEVNGGPRTVPVVVYPDGNVVTNPEPREVLAFVGSRGG